jgi:Galactose oxidase, central domain/Cep192 domain 4
MKSMKRAMLLAVPAFLLLLCPSVRAQTWTQVGNVPVCSGAATGTYSIPANPIPCFRGQNPVIYDPLDGKVVAWWSDAGDVDGEWGNSLFFYNNPGNTWSLMWASTIEQGNSNGSATLSTISRTGGVTTFTVAVFASRSFIVGDTVLIQGVSDSTFNGQFQIASTANCGTSGGFVGSNPLMCTTFTYNQTGQPDASPSASGASVIGPADRTGTPLPRHNVWAYDTKRNAVWTATDIADVTSNATTIIGSHAAPMDFYEMTYNSGTGHWAWTEICGFGAGNCGTVNNGANSAGVPCTTTVGATASCGYQFPAMGYDPTNDVVVLAAGIYNGAPQMETVLYYPATNTWQLACTTAGCGPAARQMNGDNRLVSIGGGKLLLYGGSGVSGYLGDTWIFNTTTKAWTRISSTNNPPVLENPIMDWDSAINKVVLIDDNSSGSHTWFFDPSTNQWTDAGYTGGPVLYTPEPPQATGVYDAATNQFVLFSSTPGVSIQIWTLSLPISSGPSPAASFSPASLTFTSQPIGTTSAPQQVTLTNTGNAALSISSIGLTGTNAGDFAETNNCPVSPATLGAAANCTINVTFTPSLASTETAAISISDNAGGSPQAVALSGTGTSSSGGGGGGAGGGTGTGTVAVQAAEWPGSPRPSANRTNAPVTFSVPLPDSAGVTCSPTTGPLPYNSTTTMLKLQNGSGVIENAQFRCLGLWPSGHAEWVLVDAQLPSFTEGTIDTSLNLVQISSGGGNNPASSIAVQCTGSGTPLSGCPDAKHILVNTTAATFLIKDTNYNLFDSVTVGSTVLVSSSGHGTNDGLVLAGPPSPAAAGPARTAIDSVSCNPGPPPTNYAGTTICNDTYLSNLDPASTCTIEDNGPMRSVVMCQGSFYDAADTTHAYPYMHWRTRTTFWANRSDVKFDVALRNADLSTTGADFPSAYKEFTSLEARLTMNLSTGTRTVTFGGAGANNSTTLTSGSPDNAYLYQGYSSQDEWSDMRNSNCTNELDNCVVSPLMRTSTAQAAPWCQSSTDTFFYGQCGFQIVKNGSTLATGTYGQYPAGWADEVDASSNGVEVGEYQFSANWPDALEFYSGGNEIRLGINPDQTLMVQSPVNNYAYAQRWPAYQLRTLYFNFHVGALASPSDSFLDFQQFLLGRLSESAYSQAKDATNGNLALMLPVNDPVAADTYYIGASFVSCTAGSCLGDLTPNVYKFYSWAAGGPNQLDNAWGYLRDFLERGCTPSSGLCGSLALTGSLPGRFIWGQNFYHLVEEGSIPRSDFGGWRTSCSTPTACSAIMYKWGYPDEIHGGTEPESWNGGMRQWEDEADGEDHLHTAGFVDYYFLTGDGWAYEALNDGYKDIALNTNIGYNNPQAPYSVAGYNHFGEARAAGHWIENLSRTVLYLCAIRDTSCPTTSSPGILSTLETDVAYAIAAPIFASGYPVGWTNPTNCASQSSNGTCTAGISPVRGFQTEGAGGEVDSCSASGSTTPCDGSYHWIYKPFYELPVETGLYFFNMAERSVRGLGWSSSVTVSNDGSQTNVLVPLGDDRVQQLLYGIGNAMDKESFVNGGSGSTSGFIYFTFPQYLNSTPPCVNGTGGANSDCTHACSVSTNCNFAGHAFHFFAIGSPAGSTDDLSGTSWQQDYEYYMLRTGLGANGEYGLAENDAVTSLILAHNSNPNTPGLATGVVILQDLPISVSDGTHSGYCVGSATCTITWTVPSSLTSMNGEQYRLVYYSCATGGTDCPSTGKQIVNWLGFHSNCLTTSTSAECTPNPCSGGMNAPDGTGCWEAGKTPDAHANWFWATPVTGSALQSATGSYAFTAQSGTTYTFDLKAWIPNGSSGTGGGGGTPAVTLSPTSLGFPSQSDGSTSPPASVTLTNTGTAALTIASIGIAGANAADFAETSNCSISLAAGANCAVSVTFKPSLVGTETAALTISDNAAGSPQSVPLTGQGTAPAIQPPAPGTIGGAVITSNTQFSSEPEDLASALSACTGCQFQGSSDLLPGQELQVTLESGTSTPTAASVTLRLGTLNGTVTAVGTNQFSLQLLKGAAGPSTALVLAPSGVTSYSGFSSSSGPVQVGQVVAVRGLLFKSGPQGGPTLLADRVVLGP